MKRLDSRMRATLWLAVVLSVGAGCGDRSTPSADTGLRTLSGALDYGPDLVVTEVRGPASARMSEPFSATVKVCNQGTAPATNYYSRPWLELYLSMDADLTFPPSMPGTEPLPGDQRMIGTVEVPLLEAGQCATLSLNVSAYLPPDAQGAEGAYYLGAFVDVRQQLQELREDNNVHVAGLMGVGYRPDLVVTEVSGPASVRMSEPFTATVKVCNQGTVSTGSSYSLPWVELYLSMDAHLTLPQTGPGAPPPPGDQRMLGSVEVPSLEPGQCAARTLNVSAYLPSDAMGAEGAYFLGAIVDATQMKLELREDNNTHAGGLMGVGYRPDLVVTEVRGPASVRQGDPFTATVKVCNQGTTSSGNSYSRPWLELYLSTDATLSLPPSMPGPMPTDQRMVASVEVPPLAPGQCTTRSLNGSAWLPPDAQGDGAYYLGAIVDVRQVEQELREDNNAHVGGLMGVGYRSDLVVTEVRGPASAQWGAPFTATVTVCNQGTVSSGSYQQPSLELYLSTDATLMARPAGPGTPLPTDQRMVGSMALQPLAPGQCMTQSLSGNAYLPPDAQGDGAYYLGAIVDAFQTEQELREDNNAHVGGLMGVGSGADLVVVEVSGPSSVRSGEAFTATVKVCNQGTASTSGSYNPPRLELYLSMDTALTLPPASGPSMPYPTDQRMVGFVELQTLAAGQCVTRSLSGYAWLPPDAQGAEGAYYLGAIVDASQSVLELREDNNAQVGGLLGVGNLPDLVVTQVSGPASVSHGGSFTAMVTVCNQGTLSSSNSFQQPRLELYLSTDATLELAPQQGPGAPRPMDQVMLTSLELPPLEPGRCVTRSLQAWAYLPPEAQGEGAYYLGAIIDNSRVVRELREDNNVHVGGLMGVGYRSDLVVTEVRGPASVRPGEPFTATVKVCNQGTASSYASYNRARLELYLSTDAALTPPGPGMPYPQPRDQSVIGNVELDPLEPGQCVTRSLSAYSYVPPDARVPGVLYLGAFIDAYGAVQELREDNNAFIGGLLGVGDAPDLVVTEVSGPTSVLRGASFTATVTVCNQGTVFAGSYMRPRLQLYLSTDASLTLPGPGMPQSPPPGDQTLVGSVEVESLAPGQCVTLGVPASAYAPPEAPWDGALYLGAGIDTYQQQEELREDNNLHVGGLMGVGSRADLVVTEVGAPASVLPGQSFTTTVKVCNQGTVGTSGPSWPRLELYLSTTSKLPPMPSQGPGAPPAGDVSRIGGKEVQPLAAGQCVTLDVESMAYPPPEAQPDGVLYLGAIIDAHQSESELREDNNARVGGQVGVGYRSDLVVTEVSGPTSVYNGEPITVMVRVCNQGTQPTSGMYSQPQVYLYLSTDAVLSMPAPNMPPQQRDQTVIGSVNLDPLAAGQCVTQSVSATAYLPPDAQPGSTGYLGAIADVHQVETELREDNNTRSDFALQLNW